MQANMWTSKLANKQTSEQAIKRASKQANDHLSKWAYKWVVSQVHEQPQDQKKSSKNSALIEMQFLKEQLPSEQARNQASKPWASKLICTYGQNFYRWKAWQP